MLVVDGVLGSRFALAEAVVQPGVDVECAADAEEAWRVLAGGSFDLVIADNELESADGLSLLRRIRDAHPEVARALVVDEDDPRFVQRAIEEVDLCFVLRKPWIPEPVRRAVREVVCAAPRYGRWARALPSGSVTPWRSPSAVASTTPRVQDLRERREWRVRGLLSGLNACEATRQLFGLLRAELSRPYAIRRWIWVDESHEHAFRIVEGRALESELPLDALDRGEIAALEAARSLRRPAKLDGVDGGSDGHAMVGFGFRQRARRLVTSVIWTDDDHAAELVCVLSDLYDGLRHACRRIRDEERRRWSAQRLAARVSEELRMPMGALVHELDLLCDEASRAGLSTERVGRVHTESHRVMEAMEHLEGSMRHDMRSSSARR